MIRLLDFGQSNDTLNGVTMKIEGISARLGSKSISNDDILKIIEENSRDFEGDLSKTLGNVGDVTATIPDQGLCQVGKRKHA